MTVLSRSKSVLQAWKDTEQFVCDNKQFSLNQIRWLIRNRKYNGLEGVLRKVGKRWYINEDAFSDWLDNEGCRRA